MSTTELVAELGPHVRGLMRAEYDALVADGWFEDQRVELLRGMIVELSPTNRPHDVIIQWLNMWLARHLPEHLHVRVQSGWVASDQSEPVPDLAIVPARWHFTTPADVPHPPNAVLVVEVAESSLRKDLRIKASIYAEAGVENYWVFDVLAREMVLHSDPVDGVYTSIRRAAAPEVLEIASVPIPIADLIAFTFPDEPQNP